MKRFARAIAPLFLILSLIQSPLTASASRSGATSGSPDTVSLGEPVVAPDGEGASTAASPSREKGAPTRSIDGDRGTAGAQCTQAYCWYESGVDAGQTYNCVGGYYESLGRSWVGWRGNLDSNPTKPDVNEVYYVKIGWGVAGFPCGSGGAYVHPELFLPTNTVLAISNQNPVRCFYTGLNGTTRDYTNDASCPQQAEGGQKGGLAFGPATGEAAWPTATGAIWEILIPIKTTRNLTSGYNPSGPCAACIGAAVWMIDGNFSPWSYPRNYVYVNGGNPPPPSISYPTPSVSVEYSPDEQNWPGWPSKARTTAYFFTEGEGGLASFDIGKTKDYGVRSSLQLPANDGVDNYTLYNDWRMEAGQTWHWRACFKPDGKAEICGPDQTFKTAPAPDETAPQTTLKKKPPRFTNSRTAKFVLSSNELNVTYECQFDLGPYGPCSSSTPEYKNLEDGKHQFAAFAKDAALNTDPTPVSYEWTVDTVKPNTTITGGPSGTVNASRATFKFSSSEVKSTFLCSLDGSKFTKCSSGIVYSNLKDGSHTFKVKAKDRAGNVDGTPASRSWKVK